MHRVPADGGGPAEIITVPDSAAGEAGHTHVNVLPGGRKIVYHVVYPDVGSESYIGAHDLDTRETKILTLGSYPRYSSTGHLLFLDNAATLVARPFDVDKLEFTGPARALAEQVTTIPAGMGFFDVSETGRLIYLTGGELRADMTPVWVDLNGGERDVESGWSGGIGSSPVFHSPPMVPDSRSRFWDRRPTMISR